MSEPVKENMMVVNIGNEVRNADNANAVNVAKTDRADTIRGMEYQAADPVSRADTKEIMIMKKNYPFFGALTAIYAIFYTICLYKNTSGITVPFFVIGTLFYFCFCMKKLEVSLKKDSWFYMISLFLLGVSMFLTDNSRIITMNYLGIFILLVSFMLHQIYQDEKWGFGKHWSAIGTILIDSLAALGFPVQHAVQYYKSNKNKKEIPNQSGNLRNVVIGIGIAIPLVIIILALLVSADSIFGDYFTEFMNKMVFHMDLFGTMLTAVFIFFITYGFLGALSKKEIKEKQGKGKSSAVTAITFTSILSFIYLIFSGIQVFGLFMGQLQLPEGYTYAEYARQGFFQLLLVCLINLILVLICMARYRDNLILKILLTIISGCTYIMIISSAYRMFLYIAVYKLTFLRIFVLWSLLVIFLILTGIIVSIFKKSFPLFRFSMVIVTVLYIGLAFSSPDYIIARENIKALAEEAKFREYNYGDVYYLTTLSSDAAPVILKNFPLAIEQMDEYQQECFHDYKNDIRESYQKMNLRSFNVSRYQAGKILENK